MNGYGVFTWSNGKRYEGYWKDDKKDGQGILYSPDGAILKKG